MRYLKNHWEVEPDDNCSRCPLFNNGCPLIEALAHDVVWSDEDFGITCCPLYHKINKRNPNGTPNITRIK